MSSPRRKRTFRSAPADVAQSHEIGAPGNPLVDTRSADYPGQITRAGDRAMPSIDLNMYIVEEISDADYESPMLDMSPFPEAPVIELVMSGAKQSVAEMVSDLLAA